MPLIGCSCEKADTDFPPHEISYEAGHLKGEGGTVSVLKLDDIDLSAYPHLALKEGFTLHRAIYKLSGGDMMGYIVAVRTASNRGFAVELLNGAQGKFLFAPIKTSAGALEYAEFMVHETPESTYFREHAYIKNQHDFDQALSDLKDYSIIRTPPTQITRVTEQSDGSYLVELVYRCELYQRRIEYRAILVYGDGSIEMKEGYVFVEGPAGGVL
jgi:hypothetical protein